MPPGIASRCQGATIRIRWAGHVFHVGNNLHRSRLVARQAVARTGYALGCLPDGWIRRADTREVVVPLCALRYRPVLAVGVELAEEHANRNGVARERIRRR